VIGLEDVADVIDSLAERHMDHRWILREEWSLPALFIAYPYIKQLKQDELVRSSKMPWTEVREAWNREGLCRPSRVDHGTRTHELYPIINKESLLDSMTWHPFEARLTRSLIRIGQVPQSHASGLHGVLYEITDNIIQHSGQTEEEPARGITGYQITSKRFWLGICDIGRGALDSLRTNPKWDCLNTDTEALNAILDSQASRRLFDDYGGGYKKLLQTLTEIGYSVELRTGNCRVKLKFLNGSIVRNVYASPYLQGFMITITK
jgi:hypothetical protein